MPDYKPEEIAVGMACMAPIKRPGDRSRKLMDAKVVWVSHDSSVAEVRTVGSGVTFKEPFAVGRLRKPGSKE